MYRVGVDIGGTFTDVVVADDAGDLVRAKALTTPADYTEGVTAAIGNAAAELGITVEALMGDCAGFVNGTTVVTNSIAQGEGRRVGLLTTRGFKQSIYIHRGIREIQLDLQKETRPPDIVKQRHVAEIDERVNKAGEVLVELSEDDVRREVTRLVTDEGIEALAVCFLWSFRHPHHERRAGEIVAELYPDLFVTLSCDVYPRIREYERMNTAVLNAFVSAGAETYIGKLTRKASELGLAEGRTSFMQSLGGHISAREAMAQPIQLSHSGPVGGVVAASQFAEALGEREHHHRRPRRDQLRHRADPRRAPRLRPPDDDQPPADRPLDRRHPRDRRGRRLDLLGRRPRPAAGRPAQRRRLPGAGLLRQRRHPADDHRRQRDPRPDRPAEVLGRGGHPRRRRGPRRLRGERGEARPVGRGGRRRLPRHRDDPHGDGDRESQPRPRLRPARLHRDRLRRRLRPLHRRGLPRPRDPQAGDAARSRDLLRLRAAVRRRDPRRVDHCPVDLRGGGRRGCQLALRRARGEGRRGDSRGGLRGLATSRCAARRTSSSPASPSRSR